jgi:hypothetical protein
VEGGFKMNSKYILIFLFISAFIPIAFAQNFDITNNPITIKTHNNTIEIVSFYYPVNNKNMTVNFTTSTSIDNSTNITLCQINPQEVTFDNYLIRNTTQNVDMTITDRLITCETEKTRMNMGWQTCSSEWDKEIKKNATGLKQDLDSCNLDKNNLQVSLSQKSSLYDSKSKEVLDIQNQKFLFAFLGIVIGIIGTLFYQGKLKRFGDKSMDEFGKTTAG